MNQTSDFSGEINLHGITVHSTIHKDVQMSASVVSLPHCTIRSLYSSFKVWNEFNMRPWKAHMNGILLTPPLAEEQLLGVYVFLFPSCSFCLGQREMGTADGFTPKAVLGPIVSTSHPRSCQGKDEHNSGKAADSLC